MRTLRVLLAILATALLVVPPALALPVPGVRLPDGITASITSPGSVADVVWTPDGNGNVAVQVEVFRLVGGSWQQIQLWSTLRVFTVGVLEEEDVVSIPFRSSATGPVTVTFPASALGGAAVADVFVTFSELGGSPVPTSHHHVVKNQLIALGQFDLADAFDYHTTTRPVFV